MICQHVSLLYIFCRRKKKQVLIFTQVPPAMKSSKCQKSSWSGPNDVGIYSRDCQIFPYYSPTIPILSDGSGMGMWVPLSGKSLEFPLMMLIKDGDVVVTHVVMTPRLFLQNSYLSHTFMRRFYKRCRISKQKQVGGLEFAEHRRYF